MIALWHEKKEILKEKDFRDDPWRLAYNAFLMGFSCGYCDCKQQRDERPDAYKILSKNLSLAFIRFLDYIRPKGKMCVSNMECKDIEKGFDEMDWEKLEKYFEIYGYGRENTTREG